MAKRKSSLQGAKRAPRTGRAADLTRLAVGATRARRLSASQVATAALLGQFVEAAYAMFQANPGDPTPPPSPDFPAGYSLVAGLIDWRRISIIKSTGRLFYGFIAQSTTAANEFVAAFRGTVGGVEWWSHLNSIVRPPVPAPLYVALSAAGSPASGRHNRTCRVPFRLGPENTARRKVVVFGAARCRGRW